MSEFDKYFEPNDCSFWLSQGWWLFFRSFNVKSDGINFNLEDVKNEEIVPIVNLVVAFVMLLAFMAQTKYRNKYLGLPHTILLIWFLF